MAKTTALLATCGIATAATLATLVATQPFAAQSARAADAGTCADDSGLSLPPGFCATVFADNLGHARQMTVAPDGTVYVNTWTSRYFRTPPPAGGFIVALRDTDGDGKADKVDRFGPGATEGATGGTGIAIWRDGLFVEAENKVVRYTLRKGESVPSGKPVVVLDNLQMDGDHMMKPMIIDSAGNLYINSGSASNICEKANRQPGSMGKDPCEELALRAGIWKYSAAKTGQHFSPAERYATGIRNAGSLAFDSAGRLFAVQHGRDQLQNWPKLYTVQQGVELPAEVLLQVNKGDDFGWPFCYYDGFQKKLVLGPEYGGDGGKAVGRCAAKKAPVAAYPAHFAPTGLVYYNGAQFPAGYKGGVFIAFHGSWNRAPMPQDGYRVVFQPLAAGKASGEATLFADGFTGPGKATANVEHRPTSLATGPDGALYVSDDVKGRIYRIVYKGPAGAKVVAAKAATYSAADVAAANHVVKAPAGFTSEQVALGSRIFHGTERSGTCSGCHGGDGEGSTIGPALNSGKWLWADGTVDSIAKVIAAGVVQPKQYPSGMPAKGGSELSDADVQAVAAYVWTLSHKD